SPGPCRSRFDDRDGRNLPPHRPFAVQQQPRSERDGDRWDGVAMASSIRIGYHASHEQFSPRELLQLARQAEQAGFAAAMSSDHFHPWSEAQGQSGYSWSWLGAAMQATALDFGCLAIPMGWRYHPA